MAKIKKLIIACDGEAASGKSTGAKWFLKNIIFYWLIRLIYRYSSKLIIKNKLKNFIPFLKKLNKIFYKHIAKQNLHSEEISNHVGVLAKNKNVREIVNKIQMKIIKSNSRICVEGRDIL